MSLFDIDIDIINRSTVLSISTTNIDTGMISTSNKATVIQLHVQVCLVLESIGSRKIERHFSIDIHVNRHGILSILISMSNKDNYVDLSIVIRHRQR
jgi:hypothetical protein